MKREKSFDFEEIPLTNNIVSPRLLRGGGGRGRGGHARETRSTARKRLTYRRVCRSTKTILGTTSAIVSKGTKGTIFGVQCYRRGITSRLRWWTTTWSEAVSWPRVPNYWHEIVYRQYYRFLLGRIPVITRTGDLFNDQGTTGDVDNTGQQWGWGVVHRL